MGKIQLNNELNFSYPDAFKVLTEEDLKKYQFFEEAPGFCISDAQRHIMISISWRQANPFVAMLAGTADIARNMEAKIRKPMSRYGYKLEGFMNRQIGGKSADGYRYTYSVQDIGMLGESLSVKSGSNFYYIHCYLREALREESLRVLDEIFGAVTWEG
ncbi:MAG: hypothetical protein IJ198_04870 [Lachnospiraceae bacterium]|jgi:hypothetical protein|nr:hypothetical protein [Lachnospiraceae bacterium]